jgi:hypothetical protein
MAIPVSDSELLRACLVKASPVEEHMANYRAARALLGKGKSNAKKSAVNNAKPNN